jgi:SAM-dependent methyltransferase
MEKVHDKDIFYKIYDWAGSDRSKLPWAHDEPTLFLRDIVAQRGKPGKALDIGCGAGTDSLYLAGKDWDVTSLDFMPAATCCDRSQPNHRSYRRCLCRVLFPSFHLSYP